MSPTNTGGGVAHCHQHFNKEKVWGVILEVLGYKNIVMVSPCPRRKEKKPKKMLWRSFEERILAQWQQWRRRRTWACVCWILQNVENIEIYRLVCKLHQVMVFFFFTTLAHKCSTSAWHQMFISLSPKEWSEKFALGAKYCNSMYSTHKHAQPPSLPPPDHSPVAFRPQMRFPESRRASFMLWTQWLWASSKRDYHIITGVIRASFVAHVAHRGLGLLWKDILFQTEHLFTYNILFQVSPMPPTPPHPQLPLWRPLQALCGCQESRQNET